MSQASFPSRGLSDHSPTGISLGLPRLHLKKPFQIFSHVMEHPDFLSIVAAEWFGDFIDPWYSLTMKMKKVKAALVSLNNSIGHPPSRVAETRLALLNFQHSMSVPPSLQQDY